MSWPRGAAAALPLLAAAAGELVLDARVGVCGFVFGLRAAGRRRGWEAGRGSLWSPPLRPGGRRASPGGGSVDGGAREGPDGELHLSHCVLSFSLPRSRFPLCGGRRDHKGLSHIFNPPPKSKWPVWCLLHPPPPSLCPSLCLTLMSPALLFPRLCFGAADVWGNALSSSSVPPRPVLGEARNSGPPCRWGAF